MAEAEKDDYEVVDLPSEASTPPKKPVAPLKPGQYRLPSGEVTYRSVDPIGVSGAAQDYMARQSQYGREGVAGAQKGLRNLGNIPEYAKTHDPFRTAHRAAEDVTQTALGGLEYAGAPISAGLDTIFGRNIDVQTGGRIPTRVGGAIAGIATPAAEFAASRLAKLPSTLKAGTEAVEAAEAAKMAEGAAPSGVGISMPKTPHVAPIRPSGGSPASPGPTLSASAEAKPSQAERKVARVLFEKIQDDNMTVDQFLAEAEKHPDRPTFIAGGPNIRGSAGALYRVPGKHQAVIRTAAERYKGELRPKIEAHISEALGGTGDYLTKQDAMLQARRLEAGQQMAQVENLPVSLNPDTLHALQSPLVKPAIKAAIVRNQSSLDPAVRMAGQGLEQLIEGDASLPASVRVRDVQDISFALNSAADEAYKAGRGSDGKVLKDLARALRENASDPAQGGHVKYGEFLTRYGDASDELDALELGRGAIKKSETNTAEHIEKELSQMAPEARDYYKKGLAEAIFYEVDHAPEENPTAALKKLNTPAMRRKIKIAFGDEASVNDFYTEIAKRMMERETLNSLGGSVTTPSSEAIKSLTAAGRKGEYEKRIQKLSDVLKKPVETAGAHALNLMAERDAEILGDPQAAELLARALVDPKEMERLLRNPRLRPRR
jgi:hypothetical protein